MSKEADAYWFAVLGGTFVYDAWAMHTSHETASSAVRRYTEAPWQKFLLCGLLGGLALHWISEQYDPARYLFDRPASTTTLPQ